ncbi:MAG: PfkB family carbohydrate kinase, partial [Gemmatimonadaceae bacterium]
MQRNTMALSNPTPGPVVVIGGSNIDHKSQTFGSAIAGTSNPGRSRSTLGGVGRNIAENLARMGARTTLLTAVGDDADGTRLLQDTAAAGVDVSCAVRSLGSTGSYTAILDERGDLIIAVASMGAMMSLSAEAIAACSDIIATARVLVLDCNVPEAALLHAAEIAMMNTVPVLVDPVSVAKSISIKTLLDAGLPLHTVTPNCDEL